MDGTRIDEQTPSRKAYLKPEIVHEFELETRAGSPTSLDQPFDFFGLEGQ